MCSLVLGEPQQHFATLVGLPSGPKESVGTSKSRKDTRAVVSLTARYRSPTTFEYVEEECYDVSVGGMFIRSGTPAPAGTLIKLECNGDDTPGKIRGVARVVWLRRHADDSGPGGMGVKFVKLEPGSKEVIGSLIARGAQMPDPALRASLPPQPRLTDPPRQPQASAAAAPARPAPTSVETPSTAETVVASAEVLSAKAEVFDTKPEVLRAKAEVFDASAAATAAKPGTTAEATAFSERGYIEAEPGSGVLVRAPFDAVPKADLLEGDTTPPGAADRPFAWKTWAAVAGFVALFGAIVASDWFDDSESGSSEALQVDSTAPQDPTAKPAAARPGSTTPSAVAPALPTAPPVAVAPATKPTTPPAPWALPPAAAPAVAVAPPPAAAKPPVPTPPPPAPAPSAKKPPGAPEARHAQAKPTSAAQPSAPTLAAAAPEPTASPPSAAERSPAPVAAVVAAPAAAPAPAAARTPAAAPAPKTAAKKGPPMEVATACLAQGDNDCVISALEGKAKTARELELLIETLRAVGRSADAQKQMASYVKRFPDERRAASYRRLLEAQAGSRANPVETQAKPAPRAEPSAAPAP